MTRLTKNPNLSLPRRTSDCVKAIYTTDSFFATDNMFHCAYTSFGGVLMLYRPYDMSTRPITLAAFFPLPVEASF